VVTAATTQREDALFKPTTLKPLAAALTILVAAALAPPADAQSEPIKIVFSTYWPTSYDYLWKPIEHFAERVESETGGRVVFELFHSAQLFGGKEEFGALERGDIDMSAPLDIYHTGKVPELGVTSLPFLWSTPASLQKTLDAGLWELGLTQTLREKHNMVVLDVAVGGPYQFYAKDFQVRTPDDVKGRKWAVSGTTHAKMIEVLGGSPTTMSSGELYLALQRGTVDATTRPLLTGIGRKLYEVVGHLTVLNFAYFTTFLAINADKWDSLPADMQAVMKAAAKARGREQLERVHAFLDQATTLFRNEGVEVHVADEGELAAFRERVGPVYDWWTAQVESGQRYIDFARTHR
jgi:TRAP-type C4-dicarboxylate transport system substrate-binding protein